jgi:nicotinamidase-related amidase
MLQQESTGLIIIDVQDKLLDVMYNSESVLKNIQNLIAGSKILKLPIVWLEQNPQGLGRTVCQLREQLIDYQAIHKYTFNGCDTPQFIDAINSAGVQKWLVCGIEAHICVYQTCLGLLANNVEVEVVSDCISSRTKMNRDMAIQKLQNNRAGITTLEMCLFELLRDSRKAEFKQILSLIR